MALSFEQTIAAELGLDPAQVEAVARLFDQGATVPFMARYRKEATGSLDEVAIIDIRERLTRLKELTARKETVLRSLEERNLLTDELKDMVRAALTMTALEDIYLPFRPKRKTRASLARERGLEPLAELLLAQEEGPVSSAAATYIDPEKGVGSAEEALAGARDIIAETAAESQEAREGLRRIYREKGCLVSKVIPGQEEAGAKFRDYFDWQEKVGQTPGHRILAVRRGAKEGFLSLRVRADEDRILAFLERLFVRAGNEAADQVRLALADGFKRLLGPAMETEFRLETKKRAEAEAIKVFADNLRQLLLAPPLGSRRILAVDPGLRTGAKLVALDGQGGLLAWETVYLHGSGQARQAAGEKIRDLCRRHGIEAVAVGNGTGGREAEKFIRGLDLGREVIVAMVSESGASVYSASQTAREELPDLDVSLRGAVSIGRRLADPLAELVKIEPRSIGVGQYQHDLDQKRLKNALDDVVVSCVNSVGVEVNTASPHLLAYVSGLGPRLAQGIVAFRAEQGPFPDRASLLKVPGLGPKAFEQAAGFLRVAGSAQPLDGSAVHPESYPLVERMAMDLDCTLPELMADQRLRKRIEPKRYIQGAIGLPTINDILAELAKPGRDPRERFRGFRYTEGIGELTDLRPGMVVRGVVTNIVDFGVFIDIGVHQDGLAHISQLADRFVRHPSEVVKVHQEVRARVLKVDRERHRISLSLRPEA